MLIGSFGGGNFGDSIILKAIMDKLSKSMEGRVIFVIPTSNPSFVDEHYGKNFRIKTVDINVRRNITFRFFGPSVLKELRRTDVVVTTAGILFDQRVLDPRFSFISSLLPLLVFGKMIGVKVFGLCVGITPQSTRFGGWILKKTIQMHDHIATRDCKSGEIAKSYLRDSTVSVHADIAHTLDLERVECPGDRRGLHLAVNLSSYISGLYSGRESERRESEWVKEMALAMKDWLNLFERVTFVATTHKDHKLHQKIAERAGCGKFLELYKFGVEEGVTHLNKFDVAVGSRMHFCILSTSFQIPTLALSYHPKVTSYMDSVGLRKWVIPIEEAGPKTINPLLRQLLHKKSEICGHLSIRIDDLKNRIEGAVLKFREVALESRLT
jgi:polysaccharide pyruvyl transferase WcaK-like protein